MEGRPDTAVASHVAAAGSECPLVAISGHIGWMRFTSALPPKADIQRGSTERPILTQSGLLSATHPLGRCYDMASEQSVWTPSAGWEKVR